MKRVIGLLFAFGLVTAAHAAPPTNCTFPAAIDTLDSVAPTTNVLTSINQMRCVLNGLQQRSLSWGGGELACASVTVGAAQRSLVTLTTVTAIGAADVVTVSVLDDESPAMLESSALETASGTTIEVRVFNRDAAMARTGVVCAHVAKE